MQGSDEEMIYGGNLKKFLYFCSKGKKIVIFVLTYVSETLPMLYGDFCMNSYSVDSDEAMKRLTSHCFNFSEV
jgi:hypothetical protein